MLAHSGMTDMSDASSDMENYKQDPDKAWERWKEIESRNRYDSPVVEEFG